MSAAHGTNMLTIELPEGIPSDRASTSESLAKEVLIAVAIEWYREGRISQGQGALVAKMSRAEFLDELFRAKVPACQVTVDELMEEVDRAVSWHTWSRAHGETHRRDPRGSPFG
jgi:predicted HTH domain antitoxin